MRQPKHIKACAESAFEAKMKEKEHEVRQLKAWLDAGQASWQDQQAVIAQLRSRLEEYRQQIWERQKELDSYKHQCETISRRRESLQREQGSAGELEKEISRLQDLLEKEKADFAAAQNTADSYRTHWKKEFDEKVRLEAQLRAAQAENERLLGERAPVTPFGERRTVRLAAARRRTQKSDLG